MGDVRIFHVCLADGHIQFELQTDQQLVTSTYHSTWTKLWPRDIVHCGAQLVVKGIPGGSRTVLMRSISGVENFKTKGLCHICFFKWLFSSNFATQSGLCIDIQCRKIHLPTLLLSTNHGWS